MSVAKFNEAVKKAAEELRDDSSAYVSMVALNWKDGNLVEVSTNCGTTTRWKEGQGYAAVSEEDE